MTLARQEIILGMWLDAAGMDAGAQRAEQALARVGKAGEVSARQTAAAMRGLPAQLTDVVTSLQGGQSPLTVLLQQGGQVKDMFGGVGPAVRGIASFITPTAVAVGGFAAVVGGLGYALATAAAEQSIFRDVTVLSGNAAGLTADRFSAMAQSTAAATNTTVGGAREIGLVLAESGQVSGRAMEVMMKAVARVAELSGESGAKVAADFAKMGSGVADWAAEHNKAWNFITAAQYRYIKRLEEQGKAEEAMIFVSQRLTEQLDGRARQLGVLERAVVSLKKSASEMWQAVLGVDREISARDRASILADRLAAQGDRLTPKGRDRLRGEIEALMRRADVEETNAAQASDSAAKERAAIAKLRGPKGAEAPAFRPQPAVDFAIADRWDARARAAREAEREENRVLGFISKAMAEQDQRDEKAGAAATKRDKAAADARMERAAEFLQELIDMNARASIELLEDEAERGRQLVELDRQISIRRLRAFKLDPAALAMGEGEINALAGTQAAKLNARGGNREPSPVFEDVRGAIAAALMSQRNPIKVFAETLARAVGSRLAATLSDVLAEQAVGRDGGGGVLGLFLQAIGGVDGGGITVDTNGAGINAPDVNGTRGGMATGTNIVPRDMFVKVHRGEAIVPRRYNPALGGAGQARAVQMHFHVGAGQSPAQFQAAVAGMLPQLKAAVALDMARPGRALNVAAREATA